MAIRHGQVARRHQTPDGRGGGPLAHSHRWWLQPLHHAWGHDPASAEFASLYANALPGFFPLTDHAVDREDPLALTFLSWRSECRPTIRFASRFLSRGTPNLEREVWDAAVAAVADTATAEELGARLQNGLAGWYTPRR